MEGEQYGQMQFFVWGPVGGLESIPEEYSCHYNKKSQIIERIRRIAIAMTFITERLDNVVNRLT